jgi:hypothetical protein
VAKDTQQRGQAFNHTFLSSSGIIFCGASKWSSNNAYFSNPAFAQQASFHDPLPTTEHHQDASLREHEIR